MQMEEYQYYKSHQTDIVSGHIGEYAVIAGKTVKGYYKEEKDAMKAARESYLAHKSFIIQPCQMPGADIVKFYGHKVTPVV
jgi:hypothetical protein